MKGKNVTQIVTQSEIMSSEPLNPVSPTPETQTLLNGLTAGSVDAFESLAQDIHPQIAKIVRSRKRSGLKRSVDTDDLVQNVWATVLARLNRLPAFENRAEAVKYFARIARRQVTKQQRKVFAEKRDMRRDVSLDSNAIPSNGMTPSRELMYADRTTLTDIETQVLNLRLEGHNRTEIAEILKTNETKIRRVLRAVARKWVQADD